MSAARVKRVKGMLPMAEVKDLLKTNRGVVALIGPGGRVDEVLEAEGVNDGVTGRKELLGHDGFKQGPYAKLFRLHSNRDDTGAFSKSFADLVKSKPFRDAGIKQLKYESYLEELSQQKGEDMATSTDKGEEAPKAKKGIRGAKAEEKTPEPEASPEPDTPPVRKPRKKTGDTSGTTLPMKGRKPRKKTGTSSRIGEVKKPPTVSPDVRDAEEARRGSASTGAGGGTGSASSSASTASPAPAPAPSAPPPRPSSPKTGRAFDPKISDADPIAPLPTKGQMIPSSRLSAAGKKASELRDDIRYFLNNFPDLEKEAAIYKKLGSRATKTDLVKLHSRIVGKVRPAEDPRTDAQGRRVGVVLDGESYIRGIVNDMLTDRRMSGLRPEGLVSVNQNDEGKGDGVKDIGDFEVVRQPDGGFAAKREAIYRYQPSENDDRVNPSRAKNKRFEIGNSGKGRRMNNLRTNAIKSFKRDPFTSKQPRKRLNYLY